MGKMTRDHIVTALCLILFTIIAHTQAVYSLEDGVNRQDSAKEALIIATSTIEELRDAGLPYQYPNDLLLEAQQYYESQSIIDGAGGNATYENVHAITEEIAALRVETYRISDELDALGVYLDDENTTADMTEAYTLLDEAHEEYRNGRFSESQELIEIAYDRVNEITAANTKTRAIYAATRDRTADIARAIWKPALITCITLLVLFIASRNTIQRYRLRSRIRLLHKRLIVIDELLKETQKQYFEEHNISEGEYHLRTKKYGELMRDIHRQIPLLQEQIAMTIDVKETSNKKETSHNQHKQ